MSVDPTAYQPGDVVNGHRLSDDSTRWEALELSDWDLGVVMAVCLLRSESRHMELVLRGLQVSRMPDVGQLSVYLGLPPVSVLAVTQSALEMAIRLNSPEVVSRMSRRDRKGSLLLVRSGSQLLGETLRDGAMRPHFSEEVWTGLVSAYAFLSGESGGPLAGLLYERTLPTVHREALRLCLMYGISMSDDPLAVMEMLSLGGTGIPKPELNRLWAVLVAEGETGFSHGTPSGHPWRVLTDPPDRYPELSHLLYLMKSA